MDPKYLNLGENSGFELLEQVTQVNFQIIFVTGHSEFAVNAFKVRALHYLLKPIDHAELQCDFVSNW